MRHWFIPSPAGDIRISAVDGKPAECILDVEDPTAVELQTARTFLAVAATRGWLEGVDVGSESTVRLPQVTPKGRTQIVLRTTVAEAGPTLVRAHFAGQETWTGVRLANGLVELQTGAAPLSMPTVPVEAAVTVRPPERGCPTPTPCERRASEVLRSFSTRRQWACWLAHGWMPLAGSHTGRPYRVYHRTMASLAGLDRVLFDVREGHTVCVYDPNVPAEEEVLGIKLAVEHREAWLLGLNARPRSIHG